MSLKTRIARIEDQMIPPEEDGPVTIAELCSGVRDREYRRRLGRAGVRAAVLAMREVIQRFRDYTGEETDEDLIREFEAREASGEMTDESTWNIFAH